MSIKLKLLSAVLLSAVTFQSGIEEASAASRWCYRIPSRITGRTLTERQVQRTLAMYKSPCRTAKKPTPKPTARPTLQPAKPAVPTVSPTKAPTVAPVPTSVPVNSPTPRPSSTPAAPVPTPAAPVPTPANILPIPGLAQWEANMLTFGQNSCNLLKNTSRTFDELLNDSYYDAQRVFYQIGDYTKNYSYWNNCAQAAEAIYRDRYSVPNNGNLPAYWIFTRGLAEDFLRTGDTASKNAAIQISQNAAFARDTTRTSETVSADLGRETSYVILSYLDTEDLGQPRRSRLPLVIDHALGHIDQWFISRTANYVRPFMVGLNNEALIRWYERSGDSRVIPALITAADWMWDNLWRPEAMAFQYTDRSIGDPADLQPAPDLNMLIAHTYAWLYYQTGEERFRDRGDQIFEGGTKNAYLNRGKQFDQNYRLSFEYVRLRKSAPLK